MNWRQKKNFKECKEHFVSSVSELRHMILILGLILQRVLQNLQHC